MKPPLLAMGYGLSETYGLCSANHVGNWKNLWGIGEYGLREVWLIRDSTVSGFDKDAMALIGTMQAKNEAVFSSSISCVQANQPGNPVKAQAPMVQFT